MKRPACNFYKHFRFNQKLANGFGNTGSGTCPARIRDQDLFRQQ